MDNHARDFYTRLERSGLTVEQAFYVCERLTDLVKTRRQETTAAHSLARDDREAMAARQKGLEQSLQFYADCLDRGVLTQDQHDLCCETARLAYNPEAAINPF